MTQKGRIITPLEQAKLDEQRRLQTVPVAELTTYDIDRMKSDLYVQRLKSEPDFGKKVDELETARAPRPKLG